MWPFAKRTARQKEIRRTKAERRGAWYRRLPQWPTLLATLSTIATALLAVLILNVGGEVLDLRVGQVTPRAVTARVDLEIEEKDQTDRLRLEARDSSPNFYKLDVSLVDKIRATLDKDHAAGPQEDAGEYERIVNTVVASLRASALVEPERAGTRRITREAVLLDPTVPREMRKSWTELHFSDDSNEVAKVVDEAVQAAPEVLRQRLRASILGMLEPDEKGQSQRPLYRFDTKRSVQVAQAAYDSVQPVIQAYGLGAVLADAGVVTDAEIKLLQAEHEAYMKGDAAERKAWLRVFGRTLLAFLVVFGAAAYMVRYQQGVFSNHFRRVVSTGVLLLILGVTRLVFVGTDIPPHFAIGMQVLAAGLLGVVYADEAVLAICGALAILITMAVQESIAFFVILLAVSGVMVFGLRVVRNRGKIVLVGVVAASLAFVTSVGVGLLGGQKLGFVLVESLWAAGATLMAAFVVEGVLPGIERLFGLSTGMTLLEWSDASKPLMRMMAAEAPGTYNHSLLVGALAEAAAAAIGANGLRCRAGSYYHDIGKINKPVYFVENQMQSVSRHERLSPAMSLLVIIGHVKDGIEMAKEYKLPASLHAFIPEHHGTTLVEYFYHAAKQARAPGDPEVPDTEFRYPGPKPQSRETAIVMLCDGVEGAVRAMAEPTPNRIETVVSEIVQKRLADGQFDECDLTFRELAAIEKSLVKSLCGIYHARIVYPSKEEEKKSAAS